jgi:tetratricopeptide (TPR) repeat protein
LSFCRLGDLPRWHRTVSCWAGYARVLVGRPDEALEAFLNSENVKSGESPLRARFLLFCGEAWLRTDRQPEALDLARRGLAEACDRGERGHEAYALRLLGNILDANGDVTSAEEHYHRAVVLGAERGMRPLVAHCHLGLGKLYRRTDKPEQAQEHLATATTMYRDMGMTYWLEKAEAEVTKPAE